MSGAPSRARTPRISPRCSAHTTGGFCRATDSKGQACKWIRTSSFEASSSGSNLISANKVVTILTAPSSDRGAPRQAARSSSAHARCPLRHRFGALVGHHTTNFSTRVRIEGYSQWAAGRWRDARADFGKHRPATSFPQENRRRERKNLRSRAPPEPVQALGLPLNPRPAPCTAGCRSCGPRGSKRGRPGILRSGHPRRTPCGGDAFCRGALTHRRPGPRRP